ncbi:MAG: cation:proton antiporter [Pelagimonas sp.]|uniref:cation:proton antiporter n=1 Tax=Pelagimonas sp. TaxID=2073170 RepID=UPI003D6BD1B8
MAVSTGAGLDPVLAFALVGVLGVGSQWLAWRLRLPAIVLMLAAGLAVGPGLGLLNPSQHFGDLLQPMVAIAVAIILFEGGMVLNLHSLSDAAKGVRRLVIVGAPLGWLASTLVLHYVAGLGWASSAVFGGIMIVTGPTVIAPLLRQARLQKRPAALLQWEAIVNDPVGALAAVLAFEVVVVLNSTESAGHAAQQLVLGIGCASVLGVLGGWGIAKSFRQGWVPEYMKIPVLFVVLIAVFAASDAVLHESGLLAVTLMGLWVANSDLPSYVELRRFKEHATVLLVSGVFILLSANMSAETLAALDWRAALFVLAVIFIARPLPVLGALAFTNVPWRERALVAMTGPRGVVLVAVAGLFGERLAQLGVEDGARIAPLAFALVLSTVVLHGFTLTPVARWLGLTAGTTPGVLILGGSRWSVALAQALEKLGLQVLLADPNHAHLRNAREAGVPVYYGDILSEAAEDRLDLVAYDTLISATDNDAYNTLVATDLAPEFGRSHVFQLRRVRETSSRHALPVTLGGRPIGGDETFFELNAKLAEGWVFRTTNLTEEFTADDWRAQHPQAIPVAVLGKGGGLRLLGPEDTLRDATGAQVLAFGPPRADFPNGQA